jgi:transposase
MFPILRAGCPWRDLPKRHGPYTSVYNRFNRWRKAGIWDMLMDAIVKAHDGKVQMAGAREHRGTSGKPRG